MFKGCSSLTSLDLSNFNTSKIVNMEYMFHDCINLEYINFNNLNNLNYLDNLLNYQNIFVNVSENIVICVNDDITKDYIISELKNNSCSIIDCSNDWKSKQKKIIENSNQCIDSCDNSSDYPYEYK